MIVYLCLIIPVLTMLVLFFFFRHKTVWWEFTIPLAASLIFISIAKIVAINSLTSDTQYLGGYVEEVRYYEDWNEYIHKTCTRCSGSGKSRSCVTYDCSYVQYHPEYWTAETTLGTREISKTQYQQILYDRFKGTPSFKDLHRHYHSNDGDMYFCNWNQQDVTLEPVVISDSYENRPKASRSIYRFQEVDTLEYKMYLPYEYPEITKIFHQDAIIGYRDEQAERKLQILNSRLGRDKHVKVFIVVFKNQPVEAGYVQERYWEGSNKNEFIITIGIDENNHVKWAYDFSWTEVAATKVETRNFIQAQEKLDLSAIVDFTYKEIQDKWIPKNFHEFDILTVQPSEFSIVLITILTILLNVGLSLWIIYNDFDDDSDANSKYGYNTYKKKSIASTLKWMPSNKFR